jgi:hypothetical protein
MFAELYCRVVLACAVLVCRLLVKFVCVFWRVCASRAPFAVHVAPGCLAQNHWPLIAVSASFVLVLCMGLRHSSSCYLTNIRLFILLSHLPVSALLLHPRFGWSAEAPQAVHPPVPYVSSCFAVTSKTWLER